ETKRPDLMQPLPHQAVPGDGEVGRGDVERLADALGKKFVQRIRHAVLLVVDYEGNGHERSFRFLDAVAAATTLPHVGETWRWAVATSGAARTSSSGSSMESMMEYSMRSCNLVGGTERRMIWRLW